MRRVFCDDSVGSLQSHRIRLHFPPQKSISARTATVTPASSALMEGDTGSNSPSRPAFRLQATALSGYTTSSLSPSFKLDEGYSDDTRSQSDKDLVADNVTMLPEWVLAQSEADRAGKCFFLHVSITPLRFPTSQPPLSSTPRAHQWNSTTELAYSLLRSLSTSTLAGLVDRLNPLLHMDPVVKLPPELTFQIFSYLDPRTLLTATLASRSWRNRILDSGLWRVLYINEGWRVDTRAIRNFEQEHSEATSPQTRRSRPRHSEPDLGEPKHKKRLPPSWYDTRGAEGQGSSDVKVEPDDEGDHHMADAGDRGTHASIEKPGLAPPSLIQKPPSLLQPPLKSSLLMHSPNGAVRINWVHLYKQRRRLEANWHHGRFTNFQLPHPSYPEEAHRECVYAIQFQGKWLVSGSRDRTVRVWDLETKRLWHRPLVGHGKSVLCLQFDPSPEEDVVISGSSDKTVILWKFSTGQKLHQITNAHADSVLNLKFDHRYLVTCSKDRTVKVWNRHDLMPNDEDYPRVCKGGGASYPSYIIDLNDVAPNVLEASIANGHVKALKAYSLLMTVEGHGAAVNAMQLHGDEIVTASGDRMIKVWNIRNGTCMKTLMGHEKGIACVQFDSRRIISGSNDNTVRIYDHISGAEVACLRGHNNLVRTVQAGFGDPPGADEALRLEALEVENAFWKAQQEGAPVDLGPRALRRAGHYSNTAGSRDPRDIRALGAKIPPGGGGSAWGRIVSGSYDESILIWHKDRDGAWSIGHRLRQADAAANAARGTLSEAARAAVQAQAQQLAALQAPAPATAAQSATVQDADQSADQDVVEDTPTPPATNNNLPTVPALPDGTAAAAAAASNLPPPPAHAAAPAPNHPPPAVNPHQLAAGHHHHHLHRHNRQLPPTPPTSRVFKVQFDSRKIVCASVDPRIVGWDFACGDEEILEACSFFQGL
ncbi:uncharacterized protein N7482_003925 [Penicillium canariense]|uniref:Probable E3 ubiquitin ligase complex SCF subunit sconB n=1 Tax=Penicillium canariense TaxID=189055 RepID=A0A9W9I7E7_9EURO|nr:uncharacterized protein N7482_003925 [Penicillium canariense]KAJ5168331.1 hypothetical protein N7482_003925 [Penicillium canariense]